MKHQSNKLMFTGYKLLYWMLVYVLKLEITIKVLPLMMFTIQ